MKILYMLSVLLVLTIGCMDSSSDAIKEPEEEIEPTPTPEVVEEILHVDGRYLKDKSGNIVNLHGFAQTYSPWFNERGAYWTNYNVNGCLSYNKGLIDNILSAGWKMNFIRLHMDPYWSNTPGMSTTGESDISAFSVTRFKKYLDEVFIPMAEYAVSKGLFVVMRPPGVCPKEIAVDDDYNKYLLRVWDIVSTHDKLKNNPYVMFELANEPVNIKGSDGAFGSNTQGHFDNLKIYFQQVVDAIRDNGAENILWVPGLGYQGIYWGYANNPIEGKNIGYAVHVYPGWMGSDGENGDGGISDNGGYASFQSGWNAQVQPIADIAPIMITEMDWAPAKYDASWGKALTGTAGGAGFGANFKYIADNCGNVSWLLFTTPDLLAKFKDTAPTGGNAYTFLNDPESCPWPIYHWFKDYTNGESEPTCALKQLVVGGVNEGGMSVMEGSSLNLVVTAEYEDGSSKFVSTKVTYQIEDNTIISDVTDGKFKALKEGKTTIKILYEFKEITVTVSVLPVFSLSTETINPSIWETGSYNEDSHTLITGQYGFGGWKYGSGVDLSAYKYLIVELGNDNDSSVAFRLFDENNYWSSPATYDFGTSRKVVIELANMYNGNKVKVNPSHIYIAGFWSTGGKEIVIKSLTLTNTK